MSELVVMALAMLLGYLLGKISIKGISLGTSGVLIVALVLGHFGLSAASIKNIGLACFVSAVGLMAGPTFFENLKKGALKYVALAVITVLTGAGICVLVIRFGGISIPLAVGILNGALTSTPGLAAAIETTGDTMAAVGYGIAYPFGVLGVVLFVQLLPRFLKTDIATEVDAIETNASSGREKRPGKISIDPSGLAVFALVLVTGILLGSISVPLGGRIRFSLGVSGGALIMGLIIGHFGRIGPISLSVKKDTTSILRELGLVWFLAGTGTEAGGGFQEVLKAHGAKLFLFGAIMTIVPMVVAFLVAKYAMKLSTMNSLGSICGGMTSTPALGALIAVASSDVVAISYAATYPVALLTVVLSTQFISML